MGYVYFVNDYGSMGTSYAGDILILHMAAAAEVLREEEQILTPTYQIYQMMLHQAVKASILLEKQVQIGKNLL